MARPAGNARGPGIVGMAAVLLGGAAVLIAIIALDWYDYTGADTVDQVRFRDLAATADALDVPWLVPAYFDWLAWVLLIGVALVATLNFVRPGPPLVGAVGFGFGALGSFLTWYALQEITSYGSEGSYAFQSADAGVWFALVGFAVAGLGAALGPRRI